MKRNNVIAVLFVAFVLIFVINSMPVQNFLFSFRSFIQPNVREEIKQKWGAKPTDFLLRQLTNNGAYSGIATEILVERKEKKAVPILLRLTKSLDEQTRISAFITIGELGEERSIEPLMKIVNAGPKHNDYINALRALSLMKYEPIYPNVIELAKSKSTDRAYAISMLEHFGKPDALPILENMAKNDSEWYIRENAKQAIENIKKSQSKSTIQEKQ